MSPNSTHQTRAVIELLCQILEENNVFSIRAETLRQAKYDKNCAAYQMGKLLLTAVYICDKHNNGYSRPFEPVQSNDQSMVYIKTTLQAWGYLSCTFASLPNDFSTGSREFLLAFAWLMYKQNFIDKLSHKRSSPLHQDLKNLTMKSPPCSEETSAPAVCTDRLSLAERIQYHTLLAGKLRLAMKRLHSSYQYLTSLTCKIHQSTHGVSVQPCLEHLTRLEVHMLRYPSSFNKIVQDLEKDNTELLHLLEWKQKEGVFWEWMGSVLSAHLEDQSKESPDGSLRSSRLFNQTAFLPLPTDIGQQLQYASTRLRERIIGHEEEMIRMEQILQGKKVSQVEAEVYKMQVDKELSQRFHEIQHCAFGLEENGHTPPTHGCAELTESLVKGKHRSHRHPYLSSVGGKSEVLSPYEAKVAKRKELMQTVNTEVTKLKEKVCKLEKELQHLQMSNTRKVQNVISMEENLICLQPPPLKKYFES